MQARGQGRCRLELICLSKSSLDSETGLLRRRIFGCAGICHDPVEDPVTTACKHTFCRVCVVSVIQQPSSREHSEPLDCKLFWLGVCLCLLIKVV